MRPALLSCLAIKEIRALGPAWLACLAAMAASAVVSPGPLHGLGIGLGAFFLGAATLGALSVGHEYRHGTMTVLLSQPARRERLFLVKLGVLAAMLLTIGAVAGAVVFPDVRSPELDRPGLALLPLLFVLCVAPWLTMAFRSAIAGAVFTVALPGTLMTAIQLLYLAAYRRAAPEEFAMAVLWRETMGLCVVGAVMSWRTFMRLEAIEGPGPDVRLPQWLRRSATTSIGASALTKRHWVWLLANKELRLQQMAIAIAGLYVLGWLTVLSMGRLTSKVAAIFDVLTMFYTLSLLVLIGSLASAEERQLGTHEWLLLLPIATSKQWAVKAGMAFGLAMLLAVGLPVMLASINPTTDIGFRFVLDEFVRPQFMIWVIMLFAVSLYVSSLCTGGLWALLMSLPVLFGATLFVSILSEQLIRAHRTPSGSVLAVLLAGFGAVILRFGLTNHRSADRDSGRVWKQAIWMAAYLTFGVIVLMGLAGLAAC